MMKAEKKIDVGTGNSADTKYITFEKGAEESKKLTEARRRLSDLLDGARDNLTDTKTGERLDVNINGIFIDEDTGEYAVPIALKNQFGTVTRLEELSIGDAEVFVQHFLQRVQGERPHAHFVRAEKNSDSVHDGGNLAKAENPGEGESPEGNVEKNAVDALDGDDENPWEEAQEKRRERKFVIADTERAVVDIAQEIGQLRQAITQTEGDLTEHEETIQRIMEKLDVAQSAFGNYADETNELAQQLTHLRKKMERLQARAEAQRVASGHFAEGTSFEEAKALAQKGDKEVFSIGKNVYKRVGGNYILIPDGVDEGFGEVTTQDVEVTTQDAESVPVQETERDALNRARDAAIAQLLAAQSDHGAAMDAYRDARAAWVDAKEDSVQPGIRAQLLMQERKRFARQLREATPDGDPLTNQQVRKMEKFSAGVKKESRKMEQLLSTTGFDVLVPEQFINADGTQMTPEEIRVALNSELDAMQKSLDAQLTQEQFSQTLAQRMGQKILVSLGLYRNVATQPENGVNVQSNGGEGFDSAQKDTSEMQKTAQENVPETQESNAGVQGELESETVKTKNSQEKPVVTNSEDVPELTEKIDVEKEAVRNIAKILQEDGVSSETFRRTIQKAPLEHFVASASGDSDALRFMLTYSGDVAEEFGDKFDHEGKTRKWTFGDYMLEVEKARIMKSARSRA